MKACPVCSRLYPDEAGFCPEDGSQLSSATQVPIASDTGDARVGRVLCERYQIRRVVADGGMGRVYEALDLHQRRNVAVKVLHPDVACDSVAVQRFRREYEVSQSLPHEHIVEVTDFQATSDGSYALVMEFLYGEELRGTLQREGVLPPARLVRMVSQVALGLDEAHARKFVHRDLKPDNLFLCQTSDGDIVKVLDFGSVKDKNESAKKLTVMGTTIGSPFYMAPEQAKGEESLDQRADVWALAAIVYECVVGAVPFQGVNGPSILLSILTKEPAPPSQAALGAKYPVPPTVDRALGHALKKAAVVRTPSVGAFADELGQAYGLSGQHRQWAVTPEAELASIIEAQLPRLMTLAPVEPAAETGVDAFFGESDALGGGALAPAAPPSLDSRALGAPDMTEVIPGLPRQSSKAVLFAVAGIVVVGVIVGVVLVVLFARG